MIYLVTRTDDTDWDETQALVVRATSDQDAMRVALSSRWDGGVPYGFRVDGSNLKIEQVDPDASPGLVLESFIRG